MAPNPFEDYNSVEKWPDNSEIDNASLSAKLYNLYMIINRMLDRLDKIEQRLCDDDLK